MENVLNPDANATAISQGFGTMADRLEELSGRLNQMVQAAEGEEWDLSEVSEAAKLIQSACTDELQQLRDIFAQAGVAAQDISQLTNVGNERTILG